MMEHPYPPEHTGHSDDEPRASHALVRAARDLLGGLTSSGEWWSASARLSLVRRGDRNTVFRVMAPDGSPSGSSFVVKLAGDDAALAEADLRCMQALSGSGVVPDVLLESAAARGYVMVDAGDDTLQRILEQGSATDVMDAVRRVARVYARLHVEGRALVARTAALREGELTRELVPWMDGVDSALSWMQMESGDTRARRALARITHAWYASRNGLTLTHGDPAPSNVLLTSDGEARLVDFEYGSSRHPFYDVSVWDSLCPLPVELADTHRETYASARAELGWPIEGDEEGEYASLVAFRALALLSWLPPTARERDEPWVDGWSVRNAVVAVLERLAVRAFEDADLTPIAERALRSARYWRERWPDIGDPVPSWPALRGGLREAST